MTDKEKENVARIKINILGDNSANDIYNKIKKILYDSDLKYFDHELELYGSSSFGFRNELKNVKS